MRVEISPFMLRDVIFVDYDSLTPEVLSVRRTLLSLT